MKITEKEVRYVADLANLRITDAEVAKFRADLDGILGHIDKLNELDVTGVEPMAQVLFETADGATLRPDVAAPPLGNQAAQRCWLREEDVDRDAVALARLGVQSVCFLEQTSRVQGHHAHGKAGLGDGVKDGLILKTKAGAEDCGPGKLATHRRQSGWPVLAVNERPQSGDVWLR